MWSASWLLALLWSDTSSVWQLLLVSCLNFKRKPMMDQSILTSPPRTAAARVGTVFAWLAGIVCFGFLLSILVLIARQMIVPPPAPRIILMRNIPLPEGLKTKVAPDSLASAT